jgi:hypothetical protein
MVPRVILDVLRRLLHRSSLERSSAIPALIFHFVLIQFRRPHPIAQQGRRQADDFAVGFGGWREARQRADVVRRFGDDIGAFGFLLRAKLDEAFEFAGAGVLAAVFHFEGDLVFVGAVRPLADKRARDRAFGQALFV